jgi:hypothetical protein
VIFPCMRSHPPVHPTPNPMRLMRFRINRQHVPLWCAIFQLTMHICGIESHLLSAHNDAQLRTPGQSREYFRAWCSVCTYDKQRLFSKHTCWENTLVMACSCFCAASSQFSNLALLSGTVVQLPSCKDQPKPHTLQVR